MTWTPERWQEIETIFLDAARERPADRAAFLSSACDGDLELRAAVEMLLGADDAGGGVLDGGVIALLRADDVLQQQQFGPFRLIERIADGGMGSVWRAERTVGDFVQPAAVKVLRVGLSTERLRERFARERQTLARLLHPNVARLLDGGTTADGMPWFAMELIDGVPIDRHCDERRATRQQRLELFATVCRAVHFAHQNLVVHLDLKPGNILVDRHGVPKLVDFGVAALLADAHDEAAPGTPRPLTPDYASPELLGGAVSTAADVWSLGVVLHELLTGALPPAVAAGRATTRAPAPSRARLARDLVHVIDKALQPEPARRYVSCQEFADDIDRFLRGHAVRARAPTLGYRCARFVARNRVVVAAAATVLVALIVGLLVSLRMAAIADEQRQVAEAALLRVEQEMEHARIEATSAGTVAAFLGETFLGADAGGGAAARDRLAALIDRRAALVRRQYADAAHQRANLLDALGATAVAAGLFATAEPLQAEAMELRRATFGGESLEYALSLASLGRLRHAQGRPADGVTALRECYRLHKTLPAGVHTDVALAANDLAATERALGRRDVACELHREALELRRRHHGSDSVLVAESLNNLANSENDLDVAAQHMAEALAIRQRVLGDDDRLTIQSRINLARIQMARRDTAAAEPLLRDAIAGSRALGGLGDEALAQALGSLAQLLLQLGRCDEARQAIDEALARDGARLGEDHPQFVRLHEARARVLAAAGDHPGAVAAAAAGVRVARLQAAAMPAALAAALTVLGCHRLEAGDAAGAVAALDEALAIHAATPGHAADEVDAQFTLALACERLQRFDGAEHALLAALQLAAATPARQQLLPQIRARLRTFYLDRGQPADAARYADASAQRDAR